ncbi:MAG: hypothetical protein GOMPHAMPRED_000124 [Gomphillus americanus]|uniref:Protein kinase domain-containing protein n=1 Tax=Gomphillus americanus TaxID=1940652 RepID=A0A8H3ED10_9LECA|nr:MAG: hypothetical protein GOMPHAMPRED_000124 [Gomphillus americanus]
MTLAIAHSPHTERHLAPDDSAIKQIRQTLSKSPSRGPAFRLVTSKTSSPSQSPQSESFPSDASATLFSLSAKKRKQTLRHTSPMRTLRDSLSTQRSLSKRILQDSSDHGNAGSQPMTRANSSNDMQISSDENMLAPHHALGRREKPTFFDISKSSPLKRSEADSDMAMAASPSAKRRSVHGSFFAQDVGSPERKHVFEETGDISRPTLQYSPVFRRSNSLRKTPLSPRFDTLPAIKSRPSVGNAWDIQAAKARNRLSLEFPLPDSNSEGPFSIDVSAQPHKELANLGKLTLPPRHPLSRTITQSSFGSDIAEDSPTHAPVRHLGEFARTVPEFTRSLPVGAARPEKLSQEESNFATPMNYKLAKPHPAAFMSTGLISKRNRNLTNEQLDSVTNIGDIPDTPCKRPPTVPTPIAAPTPNINLLKARAARQTFHSFGTPSTPFNPQKSTSSTGFGSTVFGNDFNQGPSRRGSFVEEAPKSPVTNFVNDNPPTPTKQAQVSDVMNFEKPAVEDEFAVMDSKSILIPEIKIARVGGLDDSCLTSPSPKLRFGGLASFSKRDIRGEMHRPSRLTSVSTPLPENFAKPFSAASPVVNASTTPASMMAPPDPSSLSISGHFVSRPSLNDSLTVNLPATPTTTRDSLGKFSSFGASVTPSHHSAPFNVDPGVTSRFDKVEPLSTGEFSQVWRVYSFKKPATNKAFSRRDSKSTTDASVWVVKKAKKPYIGPRDRIRRLQEAEILKTLGSAEHTLWYLDHWEYQDHLYIQTEYCEEGTLHSFLLRAGQSARLDDFRIWKIMLEISKGIRHIHDSGFIHLDIKPANVLVTFEGVLKIGDFGMASTWPAPPNIDGEGDREYIGPEILMGQFDKPADIFAFGLMMLEIAGNVMLPDNGTAWQRLRSGDMSDVPSLTSSSDISNISRDLAGNPIDSPAESVIQTETSLTGFDFGFGTELPESSKGCRFGELKSPPEFMTNATHSSALDKMVRWMISPEPGHRPTVHELLGAEGVRWVEARRRAGATIFEGNYGPADEVLNHDSEMIDV